MSNRQAKAIGMRRAALFIACSLGVGKALAGCTTDENHVRHCTGISWTARLWIYIGAAVAFILCNMVLVHFIRRHYRKKKARLPAAPGARPYAPGEYWNQRREYLPGYKPPEALLPVVTVVPERQTSMSQVPSRPWMSRPIVPVGRLSTRTSEQPPAYETSPPPPALYRAGTDSTLAEPVPQVTVPSIARSGPPIVTQGQP